MIVRIKEPLDYKPTAEDSPRCWGQLQYRPTNKQVPQVAGDSFAMPDPGPMLTYFPKGATPDLPDQLARGLIDAGVAETYTGPEIVVLSQDQVMHSLTEDVGR